MAPAIPTEMTVHTPIPHISRFQATMGSTAGFFFSLLRCRLRAMFTLLTFRDRIPQIKGGVTAPGSPRLPDPPDLLSPGPLRQAVNPLHRPAQTDVGGGQQIRTTHAEEEETFHRPPADAPEGKQRLHHLFIAAPAQPFQIQ